MGRATQPARRRGSCRASGTGVRAERFAWLGWCGLVTVQVSSEALWAGCPTGRMPDRPDARQAGCPTGRMPDRPDARQAGWPTGGMADRRGGRGCGVPLGRGGWPRTQGSGSRGREGRVARRLLGRCVVRTWRALERVAPRGRSCEAEVVTSSGEISSVIRSEPAHTTQPHEPPARAAIQHLAPDTTLAVETGCLVHCRPTRPNPNVRPAQPPTTWPATRPSVRSPTIPSHAKVPPAQPLRT
jgi:hypothetical protein